MEMYDIIIIGSGPAGLSAAIYGSRAGLDCTVIEKTGMSGGQILNTYEVDNYPGLPEINGFDLGMKMREHADAFQIPFLGETVTSVKKQDDFFVVMTEENQYETKTVIFAMGAEYAKLGVAGEVELLGRGVSYCATCDGAFFRNKTVAVVGGGDVAVEDGIFLARFAKKVYVIHRRDELRAAAILQKRLFETDNIEVIWNTTVEEIKGTDVVSSITMKNKNGKCEELEVDGIFIAVGMIPNTQLVKDLVATQESGYVIADETCTTNVKGLYACGDLRTKQLRQVVTAVADGANAITSIQAYLL